MLDWIFPITCIRCGQSSDTRTSLCSSCLEELPKPSRPLCLYCGAETFGREGRHDRCRECEDYARPYHFARSAILRTEETLDLVHQLKFARAIDLAPAMALAMNRLWEEHPELREHQDWCLIPIPISRARAATRPYNQALEIAKALRRLRPGLALREPLLRHNSSVHSQSGLSVKQRQAHAVSVYALKAGYAERRLSLPAHLLLVDDIYTTGATMRACARLLKRVPGVKRIACISFLRA